MPKPKLIIFSPKISGCSCWERLFNTEFEANPVRSEIDFIKKAREEIIDAAVICFCSAQESDITKFVQLEAIAGSIPVLTCSENLNFDFIKNAARQGVNRFLQCTMEKEAIQDIVFEAIKYGGLKEFLESYYRESLSSSPHVRRIVNELVHSFPQRLSVTELSQRLGIGRSWLHRICQQVFRRSYSQFIRQIWVYQALRMMKQTGFDNTEIALHLNYSEESSMARDFRKELGITPSAARLHLAQKTPEQLIQQIFHT